MNLVALLTMAAHAALAAAPAGGDALEVRLLRITEARFVDVAAPSKNKDDDSMTFSSFGPQNSLTLTLELQGPAISHATHYGNVRLSAVDDQGRKLALHGDYTSGLTDLKSAMAQIDRNMMFFAQPDPPKDVIKVDVKCTIPSREARSINITNGEIKVRTGQTKKVVIANVMNMIGQKVKDPTVAQAGLTVAIGDPENAGNFWFKGEPGKAVVINVSGDAEGLLEIALLDEQGDDLNSTKMWSETGSSMQYTLMADEQLPKNTRLQLTVSTNSETLKVPFNISDIKLP